jgi:hypothetical protein
VVNAWRQLTVGDRVEVVEAGGKTHRAIVDKVPTDWRDSSGSLATTDRGDFPKAWVRFHGGAVIPWPVSAIDYAPT